LSTIT